MIISYADCLCHRVPEHCPQAGAELDCIYGVRVHNFQSLVCEFHHLALIFVVTLLPQRLNHLRALFSSVMTVSVVVFFQWTI